MPKSLRYATVLLFLGLLVALSFIGANGQPFVADAPAATVSTENASLAHSEGEPGTPDGEAESSPQPVTEDNPSDPVATRSAEVTEDEVAVADSAQAEGQDNSGGHTVESDGQDARSAEDEPTSPAEPEPTVITHTVAPGETLWDIARDYNIDVDTIVAANNLTDINRLAVGDELTILTVRGALHTVQQGESLWVIARAYDVGLDDIVRTNDLADPSRLRVRQQLIIPGGQAQAAALLREAVIGTDGRLVRNFDWPLSGRISSRYGPRWERIHHGLDIAVPIGTPIRAAAAGVVTYSGAMGSYGNIVIIDHGSGVETRYAHTSRNVVAVGQRVRRGELISYSGNTGNSTGPHLHFEIRRQGQSVDPELYLKR